MADYTTGTHTLTGIAFPVTATVNTPNQTVTFNLVGLLDTFNISGSSGTTITVNNTVAIANQLNLDTKGGTIVIGTLAAALGTTNVTLDGGGKFVLGGTVIGLLTNGAMTFSTGGGTTILGTAGSFINLSFAPTYFGFLNNTDIIDDRALQFTGSTSYTIANGAGAVQNISVTQGGHTFSFTTSGASLATGTFTSLTSGPLKISNDGSGGTDITVCFLAGTHIRTPDGETPVEELRIGDPVATADGRTLPVRWVGVNTVSTRFADPLRVMPVRIRAGALAENVPARDLLVSPDHALFVDGMLIQAAALVDGVSITRETRMPQTFAYYHVEVEDHALILAEGTPAETFVDNVDRMAFDNWAEYQALHDGGDSIPEMEHPRAKSARQIPGATRTRLAARASRLAAALPAVA